MGISLGQRDTQVLEFMWFRESWSAHEHCTEATIPKLVCEGCYISKRNGPSMTAEQGAFKTDQLSLWEPPSLMIGGSFLCQTLQRKLPDQ